MKLKFPKVKKENIVVYPFMPVPLAFTVTKQYRCSYKLCFDNEFRFLLLLYLWMFKLLLFSPSVSLQSFICKVVKLST